MDWKKIVIEILRILIAILGGLSGGAAANVML